MARSLADQAIEKSAIKLILYVAVHGRNSIKVNVVPPFIQILWNIVNTQLPMYFHVCDLYAKMATNSSTKKGQY